MKGSGLVMFGLCGVLESCVDRGPKIPAPNKFRGDDPKTDVGDWVAGTRAYLRGFVCAEQTKVATVLGLLERPALKWATSTSSSLQQSMEDWAFGLGVDRLLHALEDRFADKERARKAGDRIARLGQQRYSCTLQALFAEFEQLTSTPRLVMAPDDMLTSFCRAAPEKFDVALYNAGYKDWRSFGRATQEMEAKLHVQAPSSDRRKGAFPRGNGRGKAAFTHAGSASGSDTDSQPDVPSVKKLHQGMEVQQLQQPLLVRIGDSTVLSIREKVKGIHVTFDTAGKVRHSLNFYIFLELPFDLVFSMQCLRAVNPRIDWQIPKVELPDNQGVYQQCIIAADHHPKTSCYCLRAREFHALSHEYHHERLFIAWVKQTNAPPISCPPEIQQVVDQYADLMQESFGLPNRPTKHHIELLPGVVPPKDRIYRMSPAELEELKKQLETLTNKTWIRPSTFEFGAPVLFVPKGNGEFMMCIDYRGLNKITWKSTEPLPRIDNLLDMVQGCTVFSEVDLKSGYHQIEMAEEDVYNTAFKTRYGTYEFLVMPFGLCNAPGTFQTEMHRIFRPYLDKFMVVYVDDILVFSKTAREHAEHLALVLQSLHDSQYKINREKSSFGVPSVIYLGHVISGDGLAPEAAKIAAIQEWPQPQTVRDVRSFMVLQQDDGNGLRPVEFMSKKIKTQKLQDSTYKKEFYALVCALKHWKHFLLGRHFKIFSDHSTLQWMKSQGELNDKLARYIQFIDMFDFELKHKKGCYNKVADALPRMPDSFALISSTHSFGEETRQTIARLLPQDETFGPIVRNLQADPNSEPGYALSSDLLYTYSRGEERLCISQDQRLKTLLMSECHDARGHFGFLKSYAALSQRFFWKEMRSEMLRYVDTCELCQRNKVQRKPPLGLLKPLRIPDGPAQSVSTDFTDLGKTTPRGMRPVRVCVDRFSKYAEFIPLPEVARVPAVRAAFSERWVTHHEPPTSIVSDQEPKFCSDEWQSYYKDYVHSRLDMTSDHHPEANGLAKVMNQVLFQLLRPVISPDHQDWDLHLARAQLMYNMFVHSSTGFSPYRLH
ncbi:hypothetical protein CBR_g39280 [Chara braunii]|uniref:Reverse transcriptase n=1 Tax=Chara braunii TaxID=69332 RepID=A0A388K129_CHABU|nr:hypothetical protein CBR_g39280 [Chara braunii]|eukprot:GBG63737.1 hypothetical protein CBR_g39280 [Chara braunii]